VRIIGSSEEEHEYEWSMYVTQWSRRLPDVRITVSANDDDWTVRGLEVLDFLKPVLELGL